MKKSISMILSSAIILNSTFAFADGGAPARCDDDLIRAVQGVPHLKNAYDSYFTQGNTGGQSVEEFCSWLQSQYDNYMSNTEAGTGPQRCGSCGPQVAAVPGPIQTAPMGATMGSMDPMGMIMMIMMMGGLFLMNRNNNQKQYFPPPYWAGGGGWGRGGGFGGYSPRVNSWLGSAPPPIVPIGGSGGFGGGYGGGYGGPPAVLPPVSTFSVMGSQPRTYSLLP